jgi:flagellar hook-basal body complex protein FliE
MTSIGAINQALPLAPQGSIGGIGKANVGGVDAAGGGKPFKDFMLDALQEVNTMQADADQAVQKLVTGGDVNPAEVLTAVQKADMSFRMMMQIRNKLVEAYQEVNQIRI